MVPMGPERDPDAEEEEFRRMGKGCVERIV